MKAKWLAIGVIFGLCVGSMQGKVMAESGSDMESAKQLELHFDENIRDSSQKKQDPIVVGEEDYVKGVSGQAFSFDGQTYLDLGTDEGLQPEDLTVSFWIKAMQPLQEENMLFWLKEDGNYAGNGWYLSCLSSEVPLKLSIGAATNRQPMEAFIKSDRNEFFKENTWYHIAVTYDGQSKAVSFYKDGVLVHSEYANELRLSIQGTKNHKYIGFNSPDYDGGYCKLCMDEVAIYSKALSKDEVQTIYHNIYDPYHRSQMVERIGKWCLVGIGIVAGIAGVFFLIRLFYKTLLSKLSKELLAQSGISEKGQEVEEVKEKEMPIVQEDSKTIVSFEPPTERSMQEKVKVYIEENYKEKEINLNLLGELFQVTPSYLSKQFKERYELSPIEYLTKIRIEEAKKLLLTTSKTVEQIADEVGYFSSSVFIRSFKKQEEMTPGMYRKQASFDMINP